MTHIDINDNTAYIAYSFKGWIKYLSLAMVLIFIIGGLISIGIHDDIFMLVICLLGTLMCSAALSYKTETIIDKDAEKVFHRLMFFGVCRKNTFLFSQVHMSAKLHRTQYVSYPILWLITEKNKKYKIGEFLGQDVDVIANKINAFSNIAYEKAF